MLLDKPPAAAGTPDATSAVGADWRPGNGDSSAQGMLYEPCRLVLLIACCFVFVELQLLLLLDLLVLQAIKR